MELRFLEKPITGYEVLKHDDMAAPFEYDVEVSPTDGVSPPFVVDSPGINDHIDGSALHTIVGASWI
jgi:hypothetical protein